MITSTRSLPECTAVSPGDFINFDAELRWPWCHRSAVTEIIPRYQAENEPGGADRTLQRAADLRFSDTRMVAYRDFNHAEARECAFENHLDRPAIGGLFEGERAQYIGTASAKRAEIADF